jgi:hypothetical protein
MSLSYLGDEALDRADCVKEIDTAYWNITKALRCTSVKQGDYIQEL